MSIVAEFSNKDRETESSNRFPSFRLTSETLYGTDTQNSTKDTVISFLQDSHASRSALQENSKVKTTSETCGQPHGTPSASFDPDTRSLKTFQACLLPDISEPSLATWPKAGIVCDGVFYPQPSWERHISEIGSGLWRTPTAEDSQDRTFARNSRGEPKLSAQVKYGKDARWPTPKATDATRGACPSERQRNSPNLETMVKYATPQARDWRTGSTNRWEDARKGIRSCNLNDQLGGKLSPQWVGWLMGFPPEWTSLKPLAMGKFQQWLRLHGIC